MTILHVGKDPKKSFYYYTMELADNANKNTGKKWENYRPKTLSSIIKSMVDPVSIKRFEEVCLNLSDGLSHLHQEGLVQRDIKPSNVIIVNEQAKLADVGLVSLRADASTFIGTAGYIPPEGPGNPPADIYALGKSLYELLTGKNVGSFPELPTKPFPNILTHKNLLVTINLFSRQLHLTSGIGHAMEEILRGVLKELLSPRKRKDRTIKLRDVLAHMHLVYFL